MQRGEKRDLTGQSVKRIALLAVIAVFMLCMATITGNAQTSLGTITGTVTDQSGAVLPDTVVQLVNQGTGTKMQATSNGSGYYQFVDVPVGTYEIVVLKQGFKKLTRPGIVLQTAARLEVDLSMTVGAETETVEVTAASPLIEADNVSLGAVVDQRESNELPLNGRNPMNLTALVASVIPMGQTSGTPTGVNPFGWGNYQIGGGMAGQSAIFIDGAPDWGNYIHNLEIIPTQDSIAEFRVITNNLTADYGSLAGGAIEFTTKSGTKDFHGNAWEYIRNKVLNANNWFANNAGESRPAFTQNQYGFNIGGPVWLGHLYDGRKRTFFFVNWEGFNLRQGITVTTTVPNSQFLSGDLSAWGANDGNPQIYDPLTTCTNPNGCSAGYLTNSAGYVAPATPYGARQPIGWDIAGYRPYQFQTTAGYSNSINPTSLAYLNYVFPSPTPSLATNLQGNYTYNASGGGNNYEVVAKVDHDINDKNHLMGRYTHWHNQNLAVDAFAPKHSGICVNGACSEEYFVHNGILDDTATLSPKTILDVRLSVSQFVYNRIPLNTAFSFAQIGWADYAHLVEFPGPTSFSVPAFDPGSYGLFSGQGSDSTIIDAEDTYRLAGTLTRFWGNHTVKFGGEYMLNRFNYAQSNITAGLFYWNGGWTSSTAVGSASGGMDVASYMLGYPSSGSVYDTARIASQNQYPGVFVTDEWRATSKLTLHLGLRWENNLPFTERHGWLSSYDPSQNNAVLSAIGMSVPGNVNLVNSPGRNSKYTTDTFGKQFSPRAGLSYRFAPNTVFNLGYGIFWLPTDVANNANPGWDADAAYAPTNMITSVDGVSPIGCSVPTGTTSIGSVRTCNISYPLPMTNENDPTTSYVVLPALRSTTTVPGTSQSVFTWQLNALGGSPTENFTHMNYAYTQQWNAGVQQQIGKSIAIDVSYAGAKGTHLPFGGLNMNQTPDSYLATCSTINGVFGCGGSFADAALKNQLPNPYQSVVPAANALSTPTVSQGQLWKPFSEYSYVGNAATLGESFYNALEVKVTKRFSQGASINVAYTFAKFISNTDVTTGWLETIAGLQDNTNLKGEMSLSSGDAPQRLVIAYVYDIPVGRGKALLPNISRAADLVIGGWGLQGMTTLMKGFPVGLSMANGRVYTAGQRPNLVPGVKKETSGSAAYRALHGWFNPDAYADPGVDVYGNEQRNDPSLEEPGMADWDMSVVKKFPFTASGRYNMEFRAEFFNLFNRTQFSTANAGISSYNIMPDGSKQYVSVNPNVGLIFGQQNLPRIVQFALRLAF